MTSPTQALRGYRSRSCSGRQRRLYDTVNLRRSQSPDRQGGNSKSTLCKRNFSSSPHSVSKTMWTLQLQLAGTQHANEIVCHVQPECLPCLFAARPCTSQVSKIHRQVFITKYSSLRRQVFFAKYSSPSIHRQVTKLHLAPDCSCNSIFHVSVECLLGKCECHH